MIKQKSFWFTSQGLVALLFIGSVSYFLLMEHRQHFFTWLPFLILAACPLMHLFMHHGHEHSGQDPKNATKETEAQQRGED